jgi:WD40 repeat protein
VKLDRYEVVSEIGRGGMGVVFRARSPEGRDVALKVLLRSTPERLARFERELRLLRSLGEAEGFVPLLDWASSERGPMIVMPYLEGGTLRKRLEAGPLGIDAAVELAKRLARTLARAHERGIVHRDLKPDNIIFSGDGRAFVADLGLAKHWTSDDPSHRSVSVSRSGETLGTCGYMAPEQLTNAKGVGPPADVFALGVVAYECLAGRPAFTGETPIEVFVKVEQGLHEPLGRVRPDAPPWLVAVVERAITRAPEQRFRDAGELALALEGAPRARRPLLGIALAATVLALAGAAARHALAPARPAPPPAPVLTAKPAEPVFPPICRSFARTARTKLAAILGTYSGKHAAMIETVAFSPDGKRGVSASLDGFAKIWNLADGAGLATLRGHTGQVIAAVFMPDGQRVLSCSKDRTVRLWEAATGALLRTYVGAQDEVLGLAVSGDGKRAVAGVKDGTVLVIDLASGETRPLVGHTNVVYGVAISGDGKRALSTSDDATARVWDLDRGEPIRVLRHPAGTLSAAFSPDGTRAVTGSKDGNVRLFDLASGDVLATLAGHRHWVAGVAFSPDGKRALSASFDKTAKLWDLEAARHGDEPLLLTYGGFYGWVVSVAFSPDGAHALAGGVDRVVTYLDLATGKSLFPSHGHSMEILGLGVSADGRRAVTGDFYGFLRVWDVASGKETAKLEGTEDPIATLALDPGGTRVLTGGGSDRAGVAHASELILWDLAVGGPVERLEGHASTVHSVAFSPDGSRALSAPLAANAGDDALEWALGAGPATRSAARPGQPVVAVAYAPDGRRLLGEVGGKVVVLGRDGGALELVGSENPVMGLAASRHRALVGKGDGSVELWDLDRGALVATHAGGGPPVASVAVSPDGTRGASAIWDATVRLVDLANGVELDRIDLAPAGDSPEAVAFAGDGSLLVGTRLGVLLRFELTRGP